MVSTALDLDFSVRRRRNDSYVQIVQGSVRRILVCLLAPLLITAAYTEYASAKRKLDLIESDRLNRGARVELTPSEINAWVAREATAIAGVRNPQIRLGTQSATGSALIDFAKLRRAQGYEPGWLMGKLLDGERPVTVDTRIRSRGGTATVDVERVTISNVTLDGETLQFVIDNFLLPMYPTAAVGKPFQLGHRIDRLDVQPGAVTVFIGR